MDKIRQKNFLAENEISFPEIISGADLAWTISLFACAKRLLRISNAVYYWRNDLNVTNAKYKGVKGKILFNTLAIVSFKNALNEMSNKIDILKENPEYVRLAFNLFFAEKFSRINKTTLKLKSEQVFEILRLQFKDKADLTIPFLFTILDSQQKDLLKAQNRIEELENKLKERIG